MFKKNPQKLWNQKTSSKTWIVLTSSSSSPDYGLLVKTCIFYHMMKKTRTTPNLNSSPQLFLVTEHNLFDCLVKYMYITWLLFLSFLTVEFIISKLENVNREGQRREHKATVFWTGFWILYLLISYKARERMSSKRPEIPYINLTLISIPKAFEISMFEIKKVSLYYVDKFYKIWLMYIQL